MSRRVYSTEQGRICPGCDQPTNACKCHKTSHHSGSADGVIRIRRETKGRKGAGVTVVAGLSGRPDAIKKHSKRLKQLCSSGGTVKEGVIEIQGDHIAVIKSYFEQEGHAVKIAGG